MPITYCDFVTEKGICFCSRCKTPYHRQNCPEKVLRQCSIQEGPSFKIRALNFVAALIEYYKSGCKKVSKKVYEERLAICNVCTHRKGNRCAVCGCHVQNSMIIGKAMLPKEDCPLSKWPIIPNE